ncbi:MAG: DUF4234 domain-containing protein [Myxococcota bacterium]|nr:DUF4234 domain-containing protein [Myxococcota bacterium]
MTLGSQFEPGDKHDEYRHRMSIPLFIVLTLLTCGLFDIYWNYRQMEACNDLLGRDEFQFGMWLLFVILTCGLYHLYYQYKMGLAIVEIQNRRGLRISEGLPIVSVVTTLVGVGIVADCIHQLEINKIVE